MAIVILFVNIQSLPAHRPLFEQLLLERKTTAFLLNETFLSPRQTIKLPRYHLLRHDNQGQHRRANGGAAIGFLQKLPFRHHLTPVPHLPEHLLVTVYFRNRHITLATIYVRPHHPIPLSFFRYINTTFTSYIILADVNIHSRTQHQRTTFINFVAHQMHATLHRLPKHTRPESQTTPDIAITSSNLSALSTISVLDPVGSDHLPIEISIPSRPPPRTVPPLVRTSPRYDLADWSQYRSILVDDLQGIHPPTSETELNLAVDRLTASIHHASRLSIPTSTSRLSEIKLPPHYLPLITRSRQFYRDFQRTGNRDSLLHHRYLQRVLHNYIKAHKLRRWITACNNLDARSAHPTTFWKRFKTLTGQNTSHPYPLLQGDTPLACSSDKANAFATYLQDIFTPNSSDPFDLHPPPTDALLQSPSLQPSLTHTLSPDHPLTAPITPLDIQRVVKHRKSTAPGIDRISYRHVREGPPQLFLLLASLYMFILRTGFFPPDWKISSTLMFLKPSHSPSDVSSYRPIQLTSVLSKIFEKIIVQRLHCHINLHNLLPFHQAGFRPRFSLDDQLVRLTTLIYNQFHSVKPSVLVLFDITKAFDKVWHPGLLYKLRSFRLPASYLRFIYQFLSNRLAYVKIDQAFSHPVFLHCGVPQGSSLSPLLYLIYASDLPAFTRHTHLFQFADDTALLCIDSTIDKINRSLQSDITAFHDWCLKWRLQVNARKTQGIVFIPPNRTTRVHRNRHRLSLSIAGTRIKPQKTVKYLGITFDHHLTWRPHLKTIETKAKLRLNLLKRLAGTDWGLHPTTLLHTYKSFLRPILTFGHVAWIAASLHFYQRLQILERHAFRLAHRIPLPSPTQYLYSLITFPTLLSHLHDLRLRYTSRKITDNPLFLNAIDTATYFPPRIRRRPNPITLLLSLHHRTISPAHPDYVITNHFNQTPLHPHLCAL